MTNWLRKLFGGAQAETQAQPVAHPTNSIAIRKDVVGELDGRPVFDYTEDVKQLKRDGKTLEAVALLERLVEATRVNSLATGGPAAPWYWEQLAICYRQLGRIEDEVQLLREYDARGENPGAQAAVLKSRLEKAEALLANKGG